MPLGRWVHRVDTALEVSRDNAGCARSALEKQSGSMVALYDTIRMVVSLSYKIVCRLCALFVAREARRQNGHLIAIDKMR